MESIELKCVRCFKRLQLPCASSLTRGLRPVVRLRRALLALSERQNLTDPRNGDISPASGVRRESISRFICQDGAIPLPANHTLPSPELLIPSKTFISSALCGRGGRSSNSCSCETPEPVKSFSITPALAYRCPSFQIRSRAVVAAAMMSRVSWVGVSSFSVATLP